MGIILQLQDDNNLIGQPQFKEVGRNYNKQLNETKTHPTTADQQEHKQPSCWVTRLFSAIGRHSQIFI